MMKMGIAFKTGILLLIVAVIAMGATQVGYGAADNGEMEQISLCHFSWAVSNDDAETTTVAGKYDPVDPGDNGNDPFAPQTAGEDSSEIRYSLNVASTQVNILGESQNSLEITLYNAYPGYCPTVFFGLKNGHSLSGEITEINIQCPDELEVEPTGIALGQEIKAGAEIEGALNVKLTEKAAPGQPYSFSITIKAAQNVPDPEPTTNPPKPPITTTKAQEEYTLTLQVMGNGRIDASSSGPFVSGDSVTLTAVPAEGNQFVRWQGDASGTETTVQIIMDRNKTVTAVFEGPENTPSPSPERTETPTPTEEVQSGNLDISGQEVSGSNGDGDGSTPTGTSNIKGPAGPFNWAWLMAILAGAAVVWFTVTLIKGKIPLKK